MRTVKPPEERRQEILDGALQVFAQKGYEKTSIADIAAQVGMSQGLCYRYFPSKEAIYDAALEQYADYIAQSNIQKTHLEGLTLRQQIERMSGNLTEYSNTERGNRALYEFFHQKENRKMHDQLFLKVSERLVPYIAGVLTEAKARGEIAIEDTEVLARFFIFGQMAVLMDKSIPAEEKQPRIQAVLVEMLGV